MKKPTPTFAVVLAAGLLLTGCIEDQGYSEPPAGYSQGSGAGGLFSAFSRPRSVPPRYVQRNSRGHRQVYR